MSPTPLFTAILVSFTLCSCEQVVDLDGGAPSQVVIDAQLQAGTAPLVAVSLVDGFGKPAASPDLQATSGNIRSSDGKVIPLALRAGNDSIAFLTADDLSVRAGLTYTLSLQTPGFAQLKSLTSVPTPVSLRAGPLANGGILSSDGSTIRIPFGVDGLPGQSNYYHLLLWIGEASELRSPRQSGATLVPFRVYQGDRLMYTANSSGYHFSNLSFGNLSADRQLVADTKLAAGLKEPTLFVELRTVSESYYQYFRNLPSSRDNSNSLLSSPVVTSADNITGGSGLFGGYSSDIRSVAVR